MLLPLTEWPEFSRVDPEHLAARSRPLGSARHVLRSASLLDAWDLELATLAAGLTHQAPARRLTERPMVSEDPYAIWPYHLHGAIRSALRTADDHTDDGWTHTDWQRAAERALAALGDQWQNTPTAATGRTLLVACLESVFERNTSCRDRRPRVQPGSRASHSSPC